MIIHLCLFLTLLNVTGEDISTVRSRYKMAVNSSSECDRLSADLEKYTITDKLFYAYKGATKALAAKHASSMSSKLRYVKEACELLDLAASAYPSEIEIRYLRFAIEKNVPAFLGYNKHIQEDREKIVKALKDGTHRLEKSVLKDIKTFMLESGDLDPVTKKELEKIKTD